MNFHALWSQLNKQYHQSISTYLTQDSHRYYFPHNFNMVQASFALKELQISSKKGIIFVSVYLRSTKKFQSHIHTTRNFRYRRIISGWVVDDKKKHTGTWTTMTRNKNDTFIMIPLSDSELLGTHFSILKQKSPSWYWILKLKSPSRYWILKQKSRQCSKTRTIDKSSTGSTLSLELTEQKGNDSPWPVGLELD
jgi:hypothetical protein